MSNIHETLSSQPSDHVRRFEPARAAAAVLRRCMAAQEVKP